MKNQLSQEYYATILQGAERTSLRIEDVEEAVRMGQLSQDTLILYYPWTGNQYQPIWKIAELKEATESKMSCLMDYVRLQAFPWGSIAVMTIFVFVGIFQQKGVFGTDAFLQYSLGWGNTIIAGRWWTILTYVFLHNSIGHWVGNCLLIFFCAIRVERIFTWVGLLWGIWISIFSGSMMVLIFESSIVVGASVLVFGLWAMQVMAGFRYIHNLPSNIQGHYGWSNFLLFVPIVVFNTMSLGISQGAHWGAVLGGGLLGMFYNSPKMSLRPIPLQLRSLMRLLLSIMLILGLMPFFSAPRLWKYLDEPVSLQEGIDLWVSPKMWHVSNCDIQMWRVNDSSQFQIFAHVAWVPKGIALNQERLQRWWSDCGISLSPLKDEVSLGLEQVLKSSMQSNEKDVMWFWQDPHQRIVWDRTEQQGQRIVHIGCMLEDRAQSWQYCQHWLSQIQVVEGQDLVKQRTAWFETRDSMAGIEYAEILEAYGQSFVALKTLQEIVEQRDTEQWVALKRYLDLYLSESKVHTIPDLNDTKWMLPTLEQISLNEFGLLETVITFLVLQKQCAQAEQILENWDLQLPNTTEHLHQIVHTCSSDSNHPK